MKKKVWLAGALLALMAAGAFAQQGFKVKTAGKTITITGYTGTATVIKIPSKIRNLPVTAIGDNAFYKTNITALPYPTALPPLGSGRLGETN